APRPFDRLHPWSGARSAGEVTSRPNQSVLVVEDESSIASFVALYLKNAGYLVRSAATGNEALAQVEASAPALIVLDLMLPDIDGIEVCRRIRKSSDVPILMLTARDEDVDKIIGLEVGADDYLTKPVNPRELVARVNSIHRRAGTARAGSRPPAARRRSGASARARRLSTATCGSTPAAARSRSVRTRSS